MWVLLSCAQLTAILVTNQGAHECRVELVPVWVAGSLRVRTPSWVRSLRLLMPPALPVTATGAPAKPAIFPSRWRLLRSLTTVKKTA